VTRKKAKKLCLDLWRYLENSPSVYRKLDVPRKLWDKIRELNAECPLCEMFCEGHHRCRCCPLSRAGDKCFDRSSAFARWNSSGIDDYYARRDAARRIVLIVEAWDPDQEDGI
jgi:hypothetical protein